MGGGQSWAGFISTALPLGALPVFLHNARGHPSHARDHRLACCQDFSQHMAPKHLEEVKGLLRTGLPPVGARPHFQKPRIPVHTLDIHSFTPRMSADTYCVLGMFPDT